MKDEEAWRRVRVAESRGMELRREIQGFKESATAQAQTQVALKAREVEKLKEELNGATTLADLGKTLEKRWPEEAFLRTRVRRENPSKAMDSARSAVVVNPGGQLLCAMTCSSVEAEGVTEGDMERRVYVVGCHTPETEREEWQHLEDLAKKLAAKWLEKEEKIVAMTVPGGQETKWRKALEWALRVSEIKLQLFVGEETKENKGGTRGALVIKARDEQSATAELQLIRSSMNPQEVGVKVKGLAKKEKGEIKVEVQETKRGGRMAFKKAAEVHAEGKAQISWYEPKRTLMLRDVDNVITEEEIRKSISMEAGTDTGDKRCVLKSPNREMRAGGHMQW
jgi:hypothetical protein